MGGSAQPWMGQQQPDKGYPSVLNPTPFAPGSFDDLENRAAQAPQQLGQALQDQQQPQQPDPNDAIAQRMRLHAQIPPNPPQLSAENPYGSLVQDAWQKWSATQPKPQTGVKGFLSKFLTGMGGSMMLEAGLTPPVVERQQNYHNLVLLTQLASGWEDQRSMARYRDV